MYSNQSHLIKGIKIPMLNQLNQLLMPNCGPSFGSSSSSSSSCSSSNYNSSSNHHSSSSNHHSGSGSSSSHCSSKPKSCNPVAKPCPPKPCPPQCPTLDLNDCCGLTPKCPPFGGACAPLQPL